MEKYELTKDLVDYMSQIGFGDPPRVWPHQAPHICLVKIIKQMQPGEENAPSIDCSGNYEAARAELGQGGKIHGAFFFISSI